MGIDFFNLFEETRRLPGRPYGSGSRYYPPGHGGKAVWGKDPSLLHSAEEEQEEEQEDIDRAIQMEIDRQKSLGHRHPEYHEDPERDIILDMEKELETLRQEIDRYGDYE